MLAMTPSAAKRGMSAAAEVLRVLDAEATVACAVLARDAIVDVEQQAVGAVADGVHHHVQAGLVGAGDPGVEVARAC